MTNIFNFNINVALKNGSYVPVNVDAICYDGIIEKIKFYKPKTWEIVDVENIDETHYVKVLEECYYRYDMARRELL